MPQASADWGTLTENEVYFLDLDLTPLLKIGDRISSIWKVTWAIAVSTGEDDNPDFRLLARPILVNNKLTFKVGTCIPGTRYRIDVIAKTVQGETLETWSYFDCASIPVEEA